MAALETYFPTQVYRAALVAGRHGERIRSDLEKAAEVIARDDAAGQSWSKANGYRGYTSYASLDDLAWRDPAFGELTGLLDKHAHDFARLLDFDIGRRRLRLDSLWINVLEPGGYHGGHIHPGSVISGTYYVRVPDGAAGLKIEDPRLQLKMASPPLKTQSRTDNKRFVEIVPKPGTVLMWESWLRHEVPQSRAKQKRMSISFNYSWPQEAAQ